ncbi:MAG TPA: OmpA family protein [Candidatus Sulfotelmatobacter sp.]|nr:OmpA family protein [Candidatus Sulfotelmatobacter sp.]
MKVSITTRGCRQLIAGLSALIAVLVISGSAFGQDNSSGTWDIFVGYQYLHPGGSVPAPGGDPNNPTQYSLPDMTKGAGTAATYNFDPHWGLEGDFGYSRDTSAENSEWTLGAGPKFAVRDEEARFFIHALATLNRVTYDSGLYSHNGIGMVLGGGMDLTLTKKISWRLFQVDYVWAQHNFASEAAPEFPSLRRPEFEGTRLRTGIVFNFGGAAPPVPAAACSVQPTEVMVGEPISATVTASNFNPKHSVTYSWSGNGGGSITGKDTAASIDTTNAAPGNYTITANVTDPKLSKNNVASCSANYTIKPLPPKNPPTMSLSASPTDLVIGGSVNLSASCSSPDGATVSVANWTTSAGTVSGSGSSATLNTAGAPAGPVTVSATCTDSRGLTAQASTQVTLENPPPPPVNPEIVKLEARLSLHSVYFVVDHPRPTELKGGLLLSQQRTLIALAADFKKYLESKPDAHLILGGHADHRGSEEYNKALTERRVNSVKSFLVAQGVPEANIDTKAFGKDENLTTDQVKDSVENNPDLSKEERARILKNIDVVRMASNRRVDVTLSTTGQSSARVFPFNSTDALTLIGGREAAKKTTARPGAKKPVKKP